MQVMYALGDNRAGFAAQKYEQFKKRVKRHMATRGSVDRLPRLEDPDAHIIQRPRHGVQRYSGDWTERGW